MSNHIYPNSDLIPDSHYFGGMSMLNENDGLTWVPHTCKETATTRVGSQILFNNQIQNYSSDSNGLAVLDRPKYVFFAKNRFEGARERVADAVDVLSGHLELSAPKVYNLEDTTAIIVETDGFFTKSPVLNHFILTIIRAAVAHNKRPDSTNAEALIDDLISNSNQSTGDWRQLQRSKDGTRRNLKKILDKTHESIQDGYKAWATNYGSYRPHWLGIVGYYRPSANYPPLSLQLVLDRNEGYSRTPANRYTGPGTKYANWKKLY